MSNKPDIKKIILNSEPEPFLKFGSIGWHIFRNNKWEPAQAEIISSNSKIAIYIHGSDGGLGPNIGSFLESTNLYNNILAIRYNPTIKIEDSGNFIKNLLEPLIKDSNFEISIDIFAYSLGTLVTRWALEIGELRQYKNINHVILIGPANTGFYFEPDLIEDKDSQVAAKITLFIYYEILIKLIGFSDKIPNNQLLSGPTLLPDDPNRSAFLKRLNDNRVSPDIFNNLKYYILSGTEGRDFIPFKEIALLTGIENVFAVAEQNLSLGIDPVKYLELYPTLGLLWKKAFIEPNAKALGKDVSFDGFLSETSSLNQEIPAAKSKFFKENMESAIRSVPLNHAQLVGIQSDTLQESVQKILEDWIR